MTAATPGLRAAALTGSGAPGLPPEIRRAAEEFESVFIAQILNQLRIGFAPAAAVGGGGEDPFASLLRDQYAGIIARSGGIGIADVVMRELLRAQEAA